MVGGDIARDIVKYSNQISITIDVELDEIAQVRDFSVYGGKMDPFDFIWGFQQQMLVETNVERIFCKLFTSSLTGLGRI